MAATINATIKSETANSYVTLTEANSYFETVPDSTTWDNKTDDQKNRSLIAATRWIDTFVYQGDRCDENQALKFPRTNYQVDRVELSCSTIPNNIKYAQYEEARALANDTDAITGTTGNRQEFRCYLMKSGTILEGVQSELSIEAERNILSKQDVMSVDYHSAYHVMGTKWTNAADNPTNAALRTGSNYGVTYDIDQIPMVEIFVNTPLSNGLKS